VRIVFFTHYFPPEGNAPASRTWDHCLRWAKAGHEITVITGVPSVPNGVVYDGYRNRIWPQRESIDGLDVIRTWTYVAANAGGVKRILNYVSYMVSAVLTFLFFCRRPNIVIATSPQFFCGWAGVIASRLKWTKFILEIRDIWPESIVTVGAMKKGLVTRGLEVLEKWMYRSANHIVAVGEGYRKNILSKVDIPDRISVVTNGVDPEQFQPQQKSAEFLATHHLEGRFVCSYVGTIGMAHGLDVTIRAAKLLQQMKRTDFVFCLVGDGARRPELEQMAIEEGVNDFVRFTGRLDKSRVPTVLATSDCILVHLKKSELFETVIPSKIFESMAMQRPLIMGVRGESAEIVRNSGSGIDMEPDNEHDLAQALLKLRDDREFYASRCAHGREFVVANYSRDALAARFLEIIEATCRPRSKTLTSPVRP
jgi:glycosyltransferase involved in cell wall biosynthesis